MILSGVNLICCYQDKRCINVVTQNNHEFLYFHCSPLKKKSKEKIGDRKKFIRLGSNGKVSKKRHD